MTDPKERFNETIISGVLIGGAVDFIHDQRQLTSGVKNAFVDQDGNIHILTSWTGEIVGGLLQETDPCDIYVSYLSIRKSGITSVEEASQNRWRIIIDNTSHFFFQPPYKGSRLTVQSIRGY